MLQWAKATNEGLLKDVNSLRKERGMREVEMNGFSHQMDLLSKNSKQGRRAEEDLSHVMEIISRGVKEGLLKVGVVLGVL